VLSAKADSCFAVPSSYTRPQLIEAVANIYIVSGSEPVDWLRFYRAYERMSTKGPVAVADD